MSEESCKTCRFSRVHFNNGMLQTQCHYDPPKLVPVPQATPQGMAVGVNSYFPAIDTTDLGAAWCGKFEPDPMSRN